MWKLSNSVTWYFSGADVLIKPGCEPAVFSTSVTQLKDISVVAGLLSSPQTLYPTSIPLPLFITPPPIVAHSPCLPAPDYASGAPPKLSAHSSGSPYNGARKQPQQQPLPSNPPRAPSQSLSTARLVRRPYTSGEHFQPL